MSHRLTQTLILAVAAMTAFPLCADDRKDAAGGGSKTAGQFLRFNTNDRNLQKTSSFLGVKSMRDNIQIAFVLDGTDSMQMELDALKENLAALVRNLKSMKAKTAVNVEVAVVIYRDAEAVSGPVEFPVKVFSKDIDLVEKSLKGVNSQTGQPYFEEQVDEGVYQALTQLNWSEDSEGTTKWLILCGDAPPFSAGDADRKFSEEQLIKEANDRGISIYSIVCSSGFLGKDDLNEKLRSAAEQMHPLASSFMRKLSDGTGGNFLDTWDQAKLDAWLDGTMTITRLVDPIDDAAIEAMRERDTGSATAPGSIRIAVLPHLPLNLMTFDPQASDSRQSSAVQVATLIREKLEKVGGFRVIDSNETAEAFQKAYPADGSDLKGVVKSLARELRAHYVIAGDFKLTYDAATLETAMYRKLDGEQVVEARANINPNDEEARTSITTSLLTQLLERAAAKVADPEDRKVFAQLNSDTDTLRAMEAALSTNLEAQRFILQGLELLEQSLSEVRPGRETEPGNEINRAEQTLTEAVMLLQEAARIEPENPYTQVLLASCHYNLENYKQAGDHAIEHAQHMLLAYEGRDWDGFVQPFFKKEIEALYALLVKKDTELAIQLYSDLAETARDRRGHFALRAHWMLAGIYLGDWDVEPRHTDVKKAREHILQILAFWPESPEATFYNKCRQQDGNYEAPASGRTLAGI